MPNDRAPTAIAPLRAAPVFEATENTTLPLPEPLAPDMIESQGELLDAVQAHPVGDAIETLPLPPPAEMS